MKKFLAMILVLCMTLGCLVGCGGQKSSDVSNSLDVSNNSDASKSSGVSISSMEAAVRNAAQNESLSFKVSDAEEGSTFTTEFVVAMLSDSITIQGAADKNSNITWLEYSIPDFGETLYKELTLEKLKGNMKYPGNVSMGTLADEMNFIPYSYIMACINGDVYSDFYGLDTIISARDSSQRQGEWVYSMSMSGSTVTIRAEYQPE